MKFPKRTSPTAIATPAPAFVPTGYRLLDRFPDRYRFKLTRFRHGTASSAFVAGYRRRA